jgi:hypothetical protein
MTAHELRQRLSDIRANARFYRSMPMASWVDPNGAHARHVRWQYRWINARFYLQTKSLLRRTTDGWVERTATIAPDDNKN